MTHTYVRLDSTGHVIQTPVFVTVFMWNMTVTGRFITRAGCSKSNLKKEGLGQPYPSHCVRKPLRRFENL